MNDLICKSKREKRILRKKKYAIFIGIMSKQKTKRTIYLGLDNSKEDNEEEEKEKVF